MRIAVIGAGGVGGAFGASLRLAGEDVVFVARGAHAEAMRRDGLRIVGPDGERHLPDARVLAPGEEAGAFDIVLVAVKMYDLEPVASGLRPFLGPDTAVIPLQNGIEAPDILARHLPHRHVCAGVARVGAAIEAPGRIRVTTPFATMLFGERGGGTSDRLARFEEACRRAGIDGRRVDDIARELWSKFVFLAPFATVTAHTRSPIGHIRGDRALRALFERLVGEAAAVARARGAPLESGFEERTLAFVRSLPADMTSSMATDLEQGRRLELDWLTGAVVRLGDEAGVPVPDTRRLYAALAPFRDGRPQGGARALR